MADCVLGIDVGGTKTACAAVDADGRILLRADIASPADDADLMIRSLLDLIADTIADCGSQGLSVVGVGLGAAGFISFEGGMLMCSPNIAWSDVPLVAIMSERTGLACFLDNDANVAAHGERFAGVCRGVDDFVYLTLGTGIGGGIFIGGRIYRGHRGTAAEPGHMVMEPGGPPCTCGQRGCLEALASGTALEREASRLARSMPAPVLTRLCGGDLSRVTGEMVSQAAEEGDLAALEAFARVAYYLGLGIVNLIHIFDPEMVVIGGGVSHSGHLLLDETRRAVLDNGIPRLVDGVTIALSTLGTQAGLLGAAAMAWEGIGRLP